MTTTSSRRSTRKSPIPPVIAPPAKKKTRVNTVLKTVDTSEIINSATLPVEDQNSIIRTVLDRLSGKSVILHGIERTKS